MYLPCIILSYQGPIGPIGPPGFPGTRGNIVSIIVVIFAQLNLHSFIIDACTRNVVIYAGIN